MSEKSEAAVPAMPHPYKGRFETNERLPSKGRDRSEILNELTAMASEEDQFWQTGRCSGTMYHGGMEHYAFLNQAFSLYSHVNALQRDMCRSMTKFEGEIVSMTANILHAEAAATENSKVCGVVTSGGTESLFSQVLVYRERGRKEKGITEPELIMPITAHPGIDKAAHYLGVKVIHAPVRDNFLVDVDFVSSRITPNTIAIVGSAGNYPHGLIDPIEELSSLAVQHDIGLHVDCCLGGFILPWGQRLGMDIPVFDFRLPGVTSISIDTHKYGFGLKGTSVVLYRNEALRHHQYYRYAGWPGGLYASPGFAGSRSGGLIAATWASMVAHGEEGYLTAAKAIFDTAAEIRTGIESIPELKVIGNPTFCIAFTSDKFNIFHLNDYIASRGWRLNGLQLPPAVHMCVTLPQTLPGVAGSFIQALKEGVAYAGQQGDKRPHSDAMYAAAGNYERDSYVEDVMVQFLDANYAI